MQEYHYRLPSRPNLTVQEVVQETLNDRDRLRRLELKGNLALIFFGLVLNFQVARWFHYFALTY